jgi:hypothetical protein
MNLTPRDVSQDERQRLAMGMFVAGERDTFALGPDGAYATGPLPAGTCGAKLRLPMFSVKTASWGSSIGGGDIELGDVLVVAGTDTVHDFDAELAFPGRLVVHVRGEEARGNTWLVQATAAQESNHGQALGMTDENGELVFAAVLPGEYWIDVSPTERTWLQVHPQTVRIESGRETELTVDLRTFEGVLVVRDARGPLATQNVQVTSLTPTFRSTSRREQTNERGELKLRRPAGKLRVSLANAASTASARSMAMGDTDSSDRDNTTIDIEWTAAGPVPATITLPDLR